MDLRKLKQWIADDNDDAIETAWMAAVERRDPASEMAEALVALVQAERVEQAQTFGWMLVSQAGEELAPEDALNVARAVLPVLPPNGELRETGVELYRAACAQAEHFDEFLRESGLAGEQSLRRAVRTLDTCLAAKAGTYLAGRFEQRVLRAERYDPVMGQFELTDPAGTKDLLDAKLLADDFEPVPETDWRVLCRFRTDELGELLQGDLAAVLVAVCISQGGRTDTAALKELLAGRHVDGDKWSKWWSRARSAAKRSGVLSIEGRNPTVIIHHPHGRTLEDELAAQAREARDPVDCLAILRQYARGLSHRKQQPDADFVSPVMSRLAAQAESPRTGGPGAALTAALAIDMAAALGLPAPRATWPSGAEILAQSDSPAALVARLPDEALWPVALQALAECPDAERHFQQLVTLAPAGQLDPIVQRLGAGRGEAIGRAIAAAIAAPRENLQILLWLWRGPAEKVDPMPSMVDLLSRLLAAAQQISRDHDVDRAWRREMFQQIRSAMIADKCRSFRSALGEMDLDIAETVKRRVERSDALSVAAREALLNVMREAFYSLFVQAKADPWADETVIWSTTRGIARIEAQLKDIFEVKMPANSRDIGEAAAQGDLSENSDWQAAVEEQRRLQAQAAKLQEDVIRARVLHAQDVPTDSVGVGSRVTVKRLSDGALIEMNFLGPWDSDVENHVYSYHAALAQTMMGKTPGETVTLKIDGGDAEYTIETLDSAL